MPLESFYLLLAKNTTSHILLMDRSQIYFTLRQLPQAIS